MKAMILNLHTNFMGMLGSQQDPQEFVSYKESFDFFDWNNNGKISYGSLQKAMRRAGRNPTDVEVLDIINKIDDESGYLDFKEFCYIMSEVSKDQDQETSYKETFRVFSKDEEGCISADEIKFVLMHLPDNLTFKEIEEMIVTVDKNNDGKINYSEFRVMLGAIPLIIPDCHLPVMKRAALNKDKGKKEDLNRA